MSPTGLLFAYPESEHALNAFGQAVMRGPSSLAPAERERIAAYVSDRNGCSFCANVHSAAARQLLGDRAGDGPDEKLRALFAIADEVRDGRPATAAAVADARRAGADDRAVHDTVLIAAMFCMFNRYVNGFGPVTPHDPALYDELGRRIAGDADLADPVVIDAAGSGRISH